ncbi:hypothetical protein KKC88_02835 [Patescibacteria group bacterium]|nr:hypothetical protein [Patescibacteria group bacterium]MBU1672907.1 hypothetical protein [Patescibacteria group bacterium]MBU1963158.1 hypothetical protein [Patescibacteria group bacterium]
MDAKKKNKTKGNRIARYVVYVMLIGLLLFELLNYLGILNYEVEFTWTGLIITILLIFIGLQIVMHYTETNFGVSLGNRIWLIVLIGIYLDAFADMFNLYARFIWFDQVVHFNAGILLCLVLFWFIGNIEKTKQIRLPLWLKNLFIFSAALTLGVVYEIEEYLEDVFTGSNRLGDGMDTANDLVMAGMGCILTLIVLEVIFKQGIKNKENKA